MSEPSPVNLSTPDANTRSAGEMLRRAREAQGITLEALASTIKVTPGKLEALESGRIDQLPDANFARALAMTVCRTLKIDPAPVMAAMPAGRPIPLAHGRPPLNQPFKEAKGGSPLFDRSFEASSLLSLKWLAPAALLVGAVLIYALPDSMIDVSGWWRSLDRTRTTAATATPAATPAASDGTGAAPAMASAQMQPPAQGGTEPSADTGVPPAAEPPASVPSLVLDGNTPAPAAAPPGASPIAPVVPARPAPATSDIADPRLTTSPVLSSPRQPGAADAASGHVQIEAREAAWIEVRDGAGDKLLSRHVRAGESVNLEGEPPLRLRVGNAPAVTVTYKGQPVDLVPSTRNNVARLELK